MDNVYSSITIVLYTMFIHLLPPAAYTMFIHLFPADMPTVFIDLLPRT